MTAARHLVWAVVLSLPAGLCACGRSPMAPSSGDRSLVVNGVTRTYSMHVPAGFLSHVGALVVALHGAGDNGLSFERTSGLSATADVAGFVVAYPDGLFNSRIGAPDWQHYGDDFSNDVEFLRQLITVLSASLQSDPRRTYVVGFSDGGRLAHRAGVELSDLVAGVGDVGGSLFQGGGQSPVPMARAPVSVVIIHGDLDLYCGAPDDASQDQAFDYWTGNLADSCASVSAPEPLCDSRGNVTMLTSKSADLCRGGSAVRLFRMIDGRHAWYGGLLNVPGQTPFNPDLNASTGVTVNEILWNFLSVHPRL
jgi:polyhydroxybutyrate depolymerase